MGQRTQIFLVVEDEQKNRRVNVYHDQWGIGRRMPLALMHLYIKFYNKEYGSDIKEVFSISDNQLKTSHEYTIDYDKEGNIVSASGYDWDSMTRSRKLVQVPNEQQDQMPQKYEDWFTPHTYDDFTSGFCDNNNGVMVVFVREYKEEPDDWQATQEIKVGFLLGYSNNNECGAAFEKWLTPDEYMNLGINNNFTDSDFRKLFNDFLTYFEIGIVSPEEKKEDTVS